MNRRRKFLLASVLALQNSSFIYPSCQKCFSRIILVSKRSNCPKCGCTGEAKNASYRYKLSLKVAESNKLFVITVFGSCLDTFFGLTATALHRYIEDPKKIPETLDSDTTQNLLTKAVETCFIGQSFVFGVTNFENHCGHGSYSHNFLQECCDPKREVRSLVACQIVLPDPRVAGFTVIDYFHQFLQTSSFRKFHCGSLEPNSHLLALNHSNSDLSSIHGPDSPSYFLEPHNRDNFSRFWQPSLELTSIVSQLTDNGDFSALEQSRAVGTLQNRQCLSFAGVADSISCHDPIQGSWSLVSYMDKKSTAEKSGEGVHLQDNHLSAVHSSHHEIGVTNSNLFPLKIQELVESSNTESIHGAIEIKTRYSQHALPCQQPHDVHITTSLQERSTCSPPLSFRQEGTDNGSQDCDPIIWDDLPFSESLNKFLEVIESEIPITQTDAKSRKHDVDDDISIFHTDHSRLSVTPQRTAGAPPPVALRSSEATVKESSSKDNFFSNCEANPSPSTQKELQVDNTEEADSISSNVRDISEYFLPNAYLSALFLPSKDLETTVTHKKTLSLISQRDEITLRPSTSETEHSCVKYCNGCGEKSHSEMSEKLTILCPRKFNDVSDLCKFESKQYHRWPKNQGDSFTICRKLMYPLESLCSSPSRSTNTLKEKPYGPVSRNLPQDSSAGHEGSYNASVDLFDDTAKDKDSATEMTKGSQGILLQWETRLTKNYPAHSDFPLRSLSENAKQSAQNISASRYPRMCSPPPHFQSDSEYDLEDSQDFVPCSQSTPVAGFHQTRIRGMNGAFKKIPTFYSDLDAEYQKIKVSFENDNQQVIPSHPKNIKTPSQKSRSHTISSLTQPDVANPIAECLETDVSEWVPPTTQKVFPSDRLRFQVMDLRKCLAAHNSPYQKELPRKKLKHVKQRTDVCLIKKLKNKMTAIVAKKKTPEHNSEQSVWNSKESVLGLDSFSEVKCYLTFSENCPPSVSETKSAWSPELFS